jgi:predicted glycoside hydrolase/deacetylase ChbG (UPF0249 family)
MTTTAKQLVVTLDDVGSTHSANLAMVDCFTNGIATSCGLMVPCPWFEEAVTLIKRHDLPFGVHLVISCEYDHFTFGPLTRSPLLTRHGRGHVFDRSGYGFPASHADAVYAEAAAQVEFVLDHGLTPTHLESHMATIPRWDGAFDAVCDRLWERFRLPLLRARGEKSLNPPAAPGSGIPCVTHGGIGRPTLEENKRHLRTLLEACRPGINWISSHPARMSEELRATAVGKEDRFAETRENDRLTWTDPEVRSWIAELDLTLVGVAEALGRPLLAQRASG